MSLTRQRNGAPDKGPPDGLARRAGVRLGASRRALSETAAQDTAKLVEDLRVCRLELETQKELLRCLQIDSEGSRDRFAALYDFAPVGYLTLDESGRILEANLTAAKLMAMERSELVGKTMWQFIAAESKDTFYLHQHKLLASEAPQAAEVRLLRRTGTGWDAHWEAQTNSVAIRDGRTNRLQCWMALSDITRQKQAETALLRSEQALNDFFSEAPLGLLLIAPNGQILRANQAQAAMLGYSIEELIDRAFAAFCADPEVMEASLHRLARKHSVQENLLRLQCQDGSILYVAAIANGLWEEGKLVHSRWFVRDVTRRMDLQKEILAIGERMQERIGRDLHDDVCQRLAGIEFLARALERQLEGAEGDASTRAKEISLIARQSLAITREMSHGLAPTHLRGEGLEESLGSLAVQTKRLFQIDCQFHCDAPVSALDSEAVIHLYRIAQEAINNAVKHGKARHIEIKLKATGNHTVLGVENDGARLLRGPSRKTGFGLHIMEYRAASLGGSLAVHNREHGGVSVVCAIPNARVNPHPKANDEC